MKKVKVVFIEGNYTTHTAVKSVREDVKTNELVIAFNDKGAGVLSGQIIPYSLDKISNWIVY